MLDGGQRISYRELNTLAERVAGRLRSLGVGPESRLGLYTAGAGRGRRDARRPQGRWGVRGLDARCDTTSWPSSCQTPAVLVLTAERLAERADFLGAPVLTVESAREMKRRGRLGEVEDVAMPDSLAYVAYADAPLSECAAWR